MIATTGAPGAVRELAIADALAWEATCLTGIAAGHRAAITQLEHASADRFRGVRD